MPGAHADQIKVTQRDTGIFRETVIHGCLKGGVPLSEDERRSLASINELPRNFPPLQLDAIEADAKEILKDEENTPDMRNDASQLVSVIKSLRGMEVAQRVLDACDAARRDLEELSNPSAELVKWITERRCIFRGIEELERTSRTMASRLDTQIESAILVGVLIQRLDVRPFEPHAKRGRNVQRGQHTSKQKRAENARRLQEHIIRRWKEIEAQCDGSFKVKHIDELVANAMKCGTRTVMKARRSVALTRRRRSS